MTTKEEMDIWLKENGYIRRANTFMWIALVFVIWSTSLGAMYYLTTEGYFQDDIDINPGDNIIDNNYSFNPLTMNAYENDFTIVNRIYTNCTQ